MKQRAQPSEAGSESRNLNPICLNQRELHEWRDPKTQGNPVGGRRHRMQLGVGWDLGALFLQENEDVRKSQMSSRSSSDSD